MTHLWKFLKFLLRHFFQIVGVLTIVLILLVVGFIKKASEEPPALPEHMFITMDLTGGVYEGEPDMFEYYLRAEGWPLVSLLQGLQEMAADARVEGVIFNISGLNLNLAQADELRAAMADLRTAGKHTVAFADTFGEMTPANTLYYLASACDEVWMQPSGLVGLTGYAAEVPFFKGTLAKLGVVPQFAKRQAYKTFPNMFQEDHLTPEHRQSTEYLLTAWGNQLVNGVAQNRQLPEAAVRQVFADAPLTAAAAKTAKLVDRLTYWVSAPEAAIADSTEAELVLAEDYYADAETPDDPPTIAVIQAQGEILSGPTDGLGVEGHHRGGRAGPPDCRSGSSAGSGCHFAAAGFTGRLLYGSRHGVAGHHDPPSDGTWDTSRCPKQKASASHGPTGAGHG
jgi:protease-4